MSRTTDEDPVKVFQFIIEIAGIKRAGFHECTAPKVQVSVAKYREGGDNLVVRKSPGLADYPDITLKRGQVISTGQGDEDFINWMTKVVDVTQKTGIASTTIRETVDIIQFNRKAIAVRRWRVLECFPTLFVPFSDLAALGEDNSFESLTLANEGFKLVG
jgi:phage tail-like protein